MYLWSGTLSVFSAKVRIAVNEKRLAVEIRDLPWTRARQWGDKPEALLAVSPRGQVPVLVDGDLAVFDSTIINEYLEERHPQPSLLPGDPAGRARCRMWEDLADDVLAANLPVLVRENFVEADPARRDGRAVEAALLAMAAHHRRLEEGLDGREYLCGGYGVADIGNFLAVAFGGTLGAPPDPALTRVAAWYQRVGARPAVKAEMDAITTAAAAA